MGGAGWQLQAGDTGPTEPGRGKGQSRPQSLGGAQGCGHPGLSSLAPDGGEGEHSSAASAWVCARDSGPREAHPPCYPVPGQAAWALRVSPPSPLLF